MKALIIYETYFGNTKNVAEAIQAGLHDRGVETQISTASDAPKTFETDILIIGAPTHNRRLPNPTSRAKADPNNTTTGVAEWLAEITLQPVPYLAAFDTVTGTSWLTGSAAKRIAKMLHKQHPKTTVQTRSFVVTGNEGPLAEKELDAARTWGRLIAADAKQ